MSKVEISKCLRSQGVCPLLMKFVQMCVENGRRCILGKSRMWKILAVQAVTPRLTLLLNCHVKNVYVSWSSSALPRPQLAAPRYARFARTDALAPLAWVTCLLRFAQLARYRFANPANPTNLPSSPILPILLAMLEGFAVNYLTVPLLPRYAEAPLGTDSPIPP